MRHFRGTILLMRGDPACGNPACGNPACGNPACGDPVRGVLTLGNPGLAEWAPSAERATEV